MKTKNETNYTKFCGTGCARKIETFLGLRTKKKVKRTLPVRFSVNLIFYKKPAKKNILSNE